MTSNDFGKDEDSVQSLLKKLESVERELNTFQNNVGRLAKLSHGLVDRNHFDSLRIKEKQVQIFLVNFYKLFKLFRNIKV